MKAGRTGLSSRGIPTESSLYGALTADIAGQRLFTFPDEEPLTVSFDLPNSSVGLCNETNLDECEQMETAWRFPVDTDNNGNYDSLTYYGIFFRTPKCRR